MRRVKLVSSMIASAGYDPLARVLEIEFLSGAVYQYADVPVDLYEALLNAPSHGRLFHTRIRNAFSAVAWKSPKCDPEAPTQ